MKPPADHPPPVFPDHEVLRLIGHGAYGEVWLARSMLGTLRAVKVVRRDAFENEKPYERELRGITQFEPVSRAHEGFVDILQAGRAADGSYFYYVMELADDRAAGAPANTPEAIESYTPRTLTTDLAAGHRLAPRECAETFRQLAEALQFLHAQGLVHRDIKPANIIFVQGRPKLADIGLVAPQDETRSWVGTDGYMPPEGPGTPAADIFSLGKVLYEAATGRDRREFPELPADASPNDTLLSLNPVWLRACAPQPQTRYGSAGAMAADLSCVARGENPPRSLPAWVRRSLIAALAAALAGAVAAAIVLTRKPDPVPNIPFRSAAANFRAVPWDAPEPNAPVLADAPRHRYLTVLPSSAIVVRDLTTHAELFRMDVADENLPVARFLTLSPDGQWLALAGEDAALRFRRVRAGAGAFGVTREEGTADAAIAFNYDHHRVAWADRAHRLQCADTRDFQNGRIKVETAGTITHLAWHPSQDLLGVIQSDPPELLLLEPVAGAVLRRMPLPPGPRHLAWTKEGVPLVACADGIFRVETNLTASLLRGAASGFVLSPDGSTLAAVTSAGLRVQSPPENQDNGPAFPLTGPPLHLSAAGDGSLFVTSEVTQRSLRLFQRIP